MLYAFTTWLTPLWASLPGACTLTLWSVAKMVCSISKKTVLLHNTGMPTFAAAASWRYADTAPTVAWIIFPLLSFGIFSFFVGNVADMAFAATWLTIPALVFFRQNLVARAWHASISAHVVGTFITLTLGTPVAWSSLGLVVPFERFVAAAGIMAASWVFNRVEATVRSYTFSRLA